MAENFRCDENVLEKPTDGVLRFQIEKVRQFQEEIKHKPITDKNYLETIV